MSLLQLQTATATLVRFPEQGCEELWENFVSQYQLSTDEQLMLHHIAQNAQVIKYGKKLRYFRFSDTVESLPSMETLLGTQLFEELWFDYFEPNAGGVAAEDLTHDFLSFLYNDSQARALIKKEGSEYAEDFLNFLYHETSLEEHNHSWRTKPLPEGSLLSHGAVCPLQLSCDVPRYLKKMENQKLDLKSIKRKKIFYVLALKKEESWPSLFAIDKDVYQFLCDQLQNPGDEPQLPAVYPNLVEAGICRPRAIRSEAQLTASGEMA